MQLTRIPLSETQAFSDFFLDYLQQRAALQPFYHRYPDVSNFGAQIQEKQQAFPDTNRQVLVETLTQQYEATQSSHAVKNNIAALAQPTTFTVTTGHQLNIFTGPLYFIYKIVTTINACKALKKAYPAYHFVPIYWMASEDHDYDEIKSFRLYQKKYTWNTDQQGAVGRFTTAGLDQLLNELPGNTSPFKEAYTQHHTLSQAARHYVNELFGSEGLVVLDADTPALKKLFIPVMKDDVLKQRTKPLVEKTNEQLNALGYKTQVYCRDINFFYLDTALRSRIEKEGTDFRILDTADTFTPNELSQVIENHPEKLSPNVILRPLYQETILPNLAYIGGPAEVVYWLQLKNVFQHHQVPFPILMPRNFALVIDPTVMRKAEKTGLTLTDFFQEKNNLYTLWIKKHANHDLSIDSERQQLIDLFKKLQQQALLIDATLGPFVEAQLTRAQNGLETFEKKLLRAEKRRHQEKLQQIEAVKDALFPNGSLQERTDNLLNFYQTNQGFIDQLIEKFDAFNFQFNLLSLP